MARILQLYAIREVALPTLMALLTIAFILLIRVIYEMIDLVLQAGISSWQVAKVLGCTLPSVLLFAAPMAVLVGTLIGVGRMTLDREILAIRASGVNILRIYAPVMLLALLLSGAIMYINGNVVPRLMLRGSMLLAQMQIQLISTLEPGRFHDKLGGKDDDTILYFRERDGEGRMQGVTLKLEQDFQPDPPKNPRSPKAASMNLGLAGVAHAAQPTTATLAATTSTTPAAAAREGDARGGAPEDDLYLQRRNSELTMIYADSGVISAEIGENRKGRQTAAILLTLNHGSIHQLSPDPNERDYVVIPFDKMEKRLFTSAEIQKLTKTRTNAELAESLKGQEGKKSKSRRELVERYSISLAFFVFTLLGIPLAIWIKPSGKSWGILLAIALLLIYYVTMKLGLTGVEVGQTGGVLVAFLPNIVFTVLGAGLWWHNLRS